MECRCYTGGDGRTRMNVLQYNWKDFAAIGTVVLLGAAVVVLNMLLPGIGLAM